MRQEMLINQLSIIRDFRQPGKVQHELIDVLFLAITAVISGCEEIEDFGYDKLDWLRQYLPFEQGIPSDGTISQIFQIIQPKEFQKELC